VLNNESYEVDYVHITRIEEQTQMPTNISMRAPRTAAQIKRALWLEGRTLKLWAAEHGYAYGTVSAVMSGKIKVMRNYGTGFDIACKLGLVVESENGTLLRAERER
jgi:gp16 family phage-associated protein